MAKYKLGDIAPIQQGSVPESESYWLLNLDMVESNTGHIYERLYVPFDKIGTSTIAFDTNNVLYSKLRPYLNKVVIPDCPGYATSEMLPLKPNKNYITREYLTYFLRSPKFVAYINEKTSGAKMPRANSSDLKSVEIECPTLENQRHITSEFDRIISIIRLRQQQLQKLDEFVKARFVEMFGDVRTNNKGLKTAKGSELFKFSSGKFLPEENRKNTGIPVYGGNGIAWYTDEPLIDYPTIIVGRVGAQCGNIHFVNVPVWITDNAIYIKKQKTDLFTLEFLAEMMTVIDFSQFADFSGQPKITQKPLENTEYLIPTIEEQKAFSSFCKQINKSKAAIQKALDETQLLFDSLMQKYFG